MGLRDAIKGWGSTAQERQTALPCDALVPDPKSVLVRAVDVDAPPGHVYRWLCQLSVAPYSYDWIDNRGRRSPQRLVPGLEQLEVGQRFVAVFRLAEFEPGSRITLEQRGRLLGHVALTYAVFEREHGKSRLVLRIAWGPPRVPFARELLSAGDLVMARRQLLNLKRLAERGGDGDGV
ncbi:MAG TPA: hypothetical protein VGI67_03560 [Thermoleophilaceae bacterium]|jgi:hypothetical protein